MRFTKIILAVIIGSLMILLSCEKEATSSESANSIGTKPVEKIFLGLYEQDNNLKNGKEPILWQILYEDESKMLVITDKCIELLPFNEENVEEMTWENSSIREWLNSEFYTNSFSEEEKERIIKEKQENKDNSKYSTKGGNDTSDKVFLLSYDEALKYFMNDKERIAWFSEYAQKKYAIDENPRSEWWLRTIGQFQFTFQIVEVTGEIFENGITMTVEYISVRPAIWIKK